MLDDEKRVVEPALGKLLRLSWKWGGSWEKLFTGLVVLAYPVLIGIAFVVASRIFNAGWPIWIMAAFLLGISSLVFFNQSVLRPLYGCRALQILDQRGWGPARPGYYAELARYIEHHGHDGRLPWVTSWGAFAWLLFYLFVVVGIYLSLQLSMALGIWALALYGAVMYPLGFLWWRAYRHRIRRMEEDGERRGYHLLVGSHPPKSSELQHRPGNR